MAPHICTCPACQQNPEGPDAQEHRALNRLVATADERSRRLFVGFLSQMHGRGGVCRLSRITGMSRTTVLRGQRELQQPQLARGRIRQPGAGRPRVEKKDLKSSVPWRSC